MIFAFGVTLMTREPFVAAGKLDRDDVIRRVVVCAARLEIEIDALDFDVVNFHAFPSRGHTITNNDAMTQHAIMTTKPVLKEPVR